MTIGENIRRHRKEKNLTQKELGNLCGIAEPNIRKYELNKANPKYATLQRIAHALNIHPNELLGLENDFDNFLFSETIKRYRIEQNISISQLAEMTEIEQNKLMQFESNLSLLNTDEIKKIAAALGMGSARLKANSSLKIKKSVDLSIKYWNEISSLIDENLDIINDLMALNDEGLNEARRQINNLTKIKDFTRNEDEQI